MKDIFQIEYVLGTISMSAFWKVISTTEGLSRWFADYVECSDDDYTFHWGDTVGRAKLIGQNNKKSVRFRWEEDEGTNYYFDLQFSISEISQSVVLRITDYSESNEDMMGLTNWWNIKIETMRKSFGI